MLFFSSIRKSWTETSTLFASCGLGFFIVLSAFHLVAYAVPFGENIAIDSSDFFVIHVIDEATGRGVPCVELKTVNDISFWTDSAGVVAFFEPGMMDRKVFFYVKSEGYEFPKDGFDYRGVTLETRRGGRAELKLKRINIAERLYRLTGAGIYRDSVLLGEKTSIKEPLLNAEVLGQDGTMAEVWNGKIFWFWGDTNRLRYPLGLFKVSGAVSSLPGKGGLVPSVGVNLEYFRDDEGFSRPVCPIPGEGPVWIEGLLKIKDEQGEERLIARFMRLKSMDETLEQGIVAFDEKEGLFKKIKELDLKEKWRFPQGHPFLWRDDGMEYFMFPLPFANIRVRAEWSELLDPTKYEAFTCLKSGEKFRKEKTVLDRDAEGRLVYSWKENTDPVGRDEERELYKAGLIKESEARFHPCDVESGKRVQLHRGSIHWNEYKKKWIMIAVEIEGSQSNLGEVWYAEADSPVGPWPSARKIVTHDKYTFYNPAHHPFFDEQEGKIIYFDGTYADTFSGNPRITPRYNYNQIMYRLDLSDPRLKLEKKKP